MATEPGYLDFAALEHCIKGCDRIWVKSLAGKRMNYPQRLLAIVRFLIGTVCGQGVECVRYRNDARQQGNLVPFKAVRISPPVERLVVQLDTRNHFLSCATGRRMLAPLVVWVFMMVNSSSVKRAGLFQDAVFNADLAHVMQLR